MGAVHRQFNDEFCNLEMLAEESAEVILAKSKLIRFGLSDNHPDYLPAKSHLEMEIGHFITMVDILIENGTLSNKNIESGKLHKIRRLSSFYKPCVYLTVWAKNKNTIN